ncbi:MAG: beta-lactamase family protein [Lentisphaeria bacterium]|nr:beta-lactamase family protein [Lentisphaeria bacterium]
MLVNKINNYISQSIFDGAVILAGELEKDLFIHTQGLADRNTNREMSLDTLFDISSISKPLGTATGILLLADRGLLDLEQPFTTYLPQYTGTTGNKINLRMLASHYSGIEPNYPRNANAEELLAKMLSSEFPREQWLDFYYSCVNYHFMGMIIENISGESLSDFARKNIFEPLGMTDTSWAVPLPHTRENLVIHSRCTDSDPAVIYDLWARKFAPRAMGNAGIFTTAKDMAKYARMICNECDDLFRNKAVKKEMFCNYLPQADRNRSFGWDMTRRLMINNFSDQSIWHSGSSGQSMWIDPQQKRFCIVLTNLFGEHDAGIAARLDIANTVASDIWN